MESLMDGENVSKKGIKLFIKSIVFTLFFYISNYDIHKHKHTTKNQIVL